MYTVLWKTDTEKLRDFFSKLAIEKGFHPTNEPHKWAEVARIDVEKYKVDEL